MSEPTFTLAELRDAAVARSQAKRARQQAEQAEAERARQDQDKAKFKAEYFVMLDKFEWLAQWPVAITHLGIRLELPECVPIEISLGDDQGRSKPFLRFDIAQQKYRWHFDLDDAIHAANEIWTRDRAEQEKYEQEQAAYEETIYRPQEQIPDQYTSWAVIAKCVERIALVLEEAHK